MISEKIVRLIENQQLNFHLGSVLRYIAGADGPRGNPTEEDLQQAKWHLEHEILRRSELEQQYLELLDDPVSSSFNALVSVVGEKTTEAEIYMRPAELLEIARNLRAFPWIFERGKSRRSQRTAFATELRAFRGQTWNQLRFDWVGARHSKRYLFRRVDSDPIPF